MAIEYDTDFDNLDAPRVSAVEEGANSEVINAQVAGILTDVGDAPVIDDLPDCVVELPTGGVSVVRELTGDDEEALAKIDRTKHTAKFMATLLERGVESLEDGPATPKALKDLLLGEREALVLGIRIATFGKEIEFKEFTCPGESCGEVLDITVDVSTIPSEEITEREFEVPLWKGGSVKVRLPNGHDQEKIFAPNRLPQQQNTILLSLCVEGYDMKKAQALGIRDRRKILDEVVLRTGGPQYDKVTFTHEVCGTEVPVVISAGDLFQDL